MKAVWKFPFPVSNGDVFTVPLPFQARVLTVQMQGDVPTAWALVETENTPEPRRFRIAGTGHDLGEHAAWHYVGTFQLLGGSLVFHLFEEGPETPF